jgi:hypothetical protein
MHRRKTRLELAALLLLTAATSAIPAHANGFATNTKSLPDASKIYTAPLQADIVDMRPKVIDTRKPEDNTTYTFNVPPPPAGQKRVIQVGNPGTAGGGNNSGADAVSVHRNSLQFAGPQSNIPARSPVSGQLPPGQVGHMLSTQATIKPRIADNGSKATPTAPANGAQINHNTPVETYAPSTTSSGSKFSAEQVSSTRVKGDLLRK